MEIRFVGGPFDGQVRSYPRGPIDEMLLGFREDGRYCYYQNAYYWVTRHAKAPHPVRLGYRADLKNLFGLDRVMTRMIRELASNARMNGYVLDHDSILFEIDHQDGFASVEVLAGERERGRESGS